MGCGSCQNPDPKTTSPNAFPARPEASSRSSTPPSQPLDANPPDPTAKPGPLDDDAPCQIVPSPPLDTTVRGLDANDRGGGPSSPPFLGFLAVFGEIRIVGSGPVWNAGLRTGSLAKHSRAGSETGVPTSRQTGPPPNRGLGHPLYVDFHLPCLARAKREGRGERGNVHPWQAKWRTVDCPLAATNRRRTPCCASVGS